MLTYSRTDLLELAPHQDALVAIDSDGCVFDSMEIKQKECFHPEIIRLWGLEAIEPVLREVAEFVNLYSQDRGSNRFVALLKTFELLPEHPGAKVDGVMLPPTDTLRRFISSGRPATNGELERRIEEDPDPELSRILDWSLTINRVVEKKVADLAPFDGVAPALERLSGVADLIICSQTPEEALVREWKQHGIDRYVRVIAGQELGTKAEHLTMASAGRYVPDRVLMVGDAPGDLWAARETGALFYPVIPGAEEVSWTRLLEEGIDRFLGGRYAGMWEAERVAEFEAALPSVPPW